MKLYYYITNKYSTFLIIIMNLNEKCWLSKIPTDVLPLVTRYLEKETRTAIYCLIYYGDKEKLWYKWYPLIK